MRRMPLLMFIAVALPSVASADEFWEPGPKHTFIVRAGGGALALADNPLLGINAGAAFRSEWDWFGFEFEPVSVGIDAFQRPNGLRIGFIHPSARFMLLPKQSVCPSIGVGVGGSYTLMNNDDDTAGEYSMLGFEGRLSLGVDVARGQKVRPGLTVDLIYPFAGLRGTDSITANPPYITANLHLGFNTKTAVWDAIFSTM